MKKSYLIVLISLALFSLVLIVGYLSPTYFTNPDTTNASLQLQNMEEFRRSFFNDGEAFLKAHPIIEFNTLYDTMRWEVFAVYVVDGGYVYSISYPLSADEEFQAYLDDIASKNMYQNTLDITMNDHLLTLVTCSYEFDNARTIVHARLIND